MKRELTFDFIVSIQNVPYDTSEGKFVTTEQYVWRKQN